MIVANVIELCSSVQNSIVALMLLLLKLCQGMPLSTVRATPVVNKYWQGRLVREIV